MGLDTSSKQWRTAKLKEYPDGLNALFRAMFVRWWQGAPEPPFLAFPSPSDLEIYKLFDSVIGQGKMGPDNALNS